MTVPGCRASLTRRTLCPPNIWKVFLRQFLSPLIYVLLVVALLSLALTVLRVLEWHKSRQPGVSESG